MDTKPNPITGGCACGAVRYRCDAEPLTMFYCHCRDCQRASGGPFVAAVLLPAKSFRFTKGAPATFATPSTSGGTHVRGFCRDCGSRLTGGQREEPTPWIGVVAGSLDDPSRFKPRMHIFVSHAQPWDRLDDDLPKYDTYMPERGEQVKNHG